MEPINELEYSDEMVSQVFDITQKINEIVVHINDLETKLNDTRPIRKPVNTRLHRTV